MNENRFLNKFKIKSDSDLKYIILQKEKYENDAVEAARQLLMERGVKVEFEKKTIVTNPEPIKQINEKKVEAKTVKNENDKNLIKLYSKRMIFVFSTLFTPLAGSILMSRNFKTLGNNNGLISVLLFGVFYNKAFFFTIDYLKLNIGFGIIFNIIGAIILTKSFWNFFISEDVEYLKKSGKNPFLILLGIIAFMIILIILIVLFN
jgi:hypothetical protein